MASSISTEGAARPDVKIERVRAAAYRIPGDDPDAESTLPWDITTMITVHIDAGGLRGFGYGFADPATAVLINETLAPTLTGSDPLSPQACWGVAWGRLRSSGQTGISACAVSVVDCALWDLKARLLGVSLVRLLGQVRTDIRAYGSGGFTSYGEAKLRAQIDSWMADGMNAVKIKIGGGGVRDLDQVEIARDSIGREADLFLDGQGAYTPKQALGYAARFADFGVTWFEEPVPADDLDGLGLVRRRGPSGMSIAAGESVWSVADVRRILQVGAVDVVQADATRCGGITGFLQIAAICEAFQTPLSSHGAPSLHAHLCCATSRVLHAEYFHDHARLEIALLDGAARVHGGRLVADSSSPGLGLTLKQSDAEPHRVA
ncbi:MAG: enolase C-terminal domain-like protein [Rhodospirillaceae bacterium]